MGRKIDKGIIPEKIGKKQLGDDSGIEIVPISGMSPFLQGMMKHSNHENRMIRLWGDVDESTSYQICNELLDYVNSGIKTPVTMVINTYGGSAHDMMAIYDMMKFAQKTLTIKTVGLGKIMSAGVLLLAAGEKGSRTLGNRARVMVHELQTGTLGGLASSVNELEEAKSLQKHYQKCLQEETKLSSSDIEEIFKGGINRYLDVNQAIEYGIVDKSLV